MPRRQLMRSGLGIAVYLHFSPARVPTRKSTPGSGAVAAALLRARRQRPSRRAAEARDELAPPDFEHRLPPDRTIEIGALSAPRARLEGYHPEGAAGRLL